MVKSIISIFIIFQSCTVLYEWQTKYPDNVIEEKAEDFIESQFDYDLDLSPITGNERLQLYDKD